jgi:hypothetical protein
MSTKRRLAIVSPPRPEDPARLLAAAIAAEKKAKAKLAGHHAAISRAGEQLVESERKVEAARANIDIARHDFEGEMAAAIAAGRAIPATSQVLGRADAAVVEAERTAAAVRAARDRLRADLRSHEIELYLAQNDIIAAVNAVLAPLAEQILEQGEAARRTLFRSAAVLNFLRAPDGDPRDDFFWKPGETK